MRLSAWNWLSVLAIALCFTVGIVERDWFIALLGLTCVADLVRDVVERRQSARDAFARDAGGES